MTYEELCAQMDSILAENANRYGDFGFGYDIDWVGTVMADARVTWPPIDLCRLKDAHLFAQALEAVCFEAARLVGTEISD